MANEVLTRKFKFYTKGCGQKYRAPEIEITLKKKDHVINYETMEEENDVWVFTASGHYRGCWGQCLDEIYNVIPYVDKYDAPVIERIVEIWRKYHLNDMMSGTKKQMECLKGFVYDRNLKESYYEQECSFLDNHTLWFDSDAEYRFGTKWLYMPIPEDVVQEIMNLINYGCLEAE